MATRRKPTKEPSKPTKETSPPTTASGQTGSGLPLDVALTPAKESALDFASKIGFPGEPPFTRGIRATMYRGRLWTMRQYAGFGTAKETNRRFKYLFAQGNEGLSVAFDLPTQMGYDSDAPMARGEVGRVGVAISTVDDMCALLDGLPLDRVSTSMTINATAAILLALYVAIGEGRGIARWSLRGTVQNDILKEYVARSTYIYPPAPSMRLALDVIEFCSREVPRWNSVSISGYHIREAGSTAAQELAFTLADGLAYVESCLARRLWARFMKERYGAKKAESMKLRTHAQTAGVSLTAQQPYNNVARVALQALAAVLGGTQSLHTNSLDETYALPTKEAVTLALRTQQVIAHESGVADTADPLAGSYYLEHLTNVMEEGFDRYLGEIEKLGGMVEAVERGYPQREITEASFRFQEEVEMGERTIVGINKYATEAEPAIPTLELDPEVERKQVERLKDVRAKRDAGRWREAMDRLRVAAKARGELMPEFLECARANASVGEQVQVLKEVFGVYHDPGYF